MGLTEEGSQGERRSTSDEPQFSWQERSCYVEDVNRVAKEGLLELKSKSLDSPHVEAGGLQRKTATPFQSAKNSKRSKRFTGRPQRNNSGGLNAARFGNLDGRSVLKVGQGFFFAHTDVSRIGWSPSWMCIVPSNHMNMGQNLSEFLQHLQRTKTPEASMANLIKCPSMTDEEPVSLICWIYRTYSSGQAQAFTIFNKSLADVNCKTFCSVQIMTRYIPHRHGN